MSILENLESLKQQIEEELDKKNKIISQFQKDLESYKELKEKIVQLESELEKNNEKLKELQLKSEESTQKSKELELKVQKLEQEKNELQNFKDKIEELKKEKTVLEKKLDGYRYSTKYISSWIPSQKESIDVLITLSESHKHTKTFDELQSETMIPVVVLKNRVLPLLVEKGLLQVTDEYVKLLEVKE
ncbi:MAG: hypothetical protein ACTSRG_02040 [Candidatus Helarchaeota archaeon]